MTLSIIPLQEEHIEDAADLVARRYRSLRKDLPLLPTRYEDASIIAGLLESLGSHPTGVAAIRGGRLVGFLSGFQLDELLGKRFVFSPEWANAAEIDESRRIYEEMYASLSPQWVRQGYHIHAVSLLGHDHSGIEAWQWLGFGFAAVDALRPPLSIQSSRQDVHIRQACADDAHRLGELLTALERHLSSGPVFWLHDLEPAEAWLSRPVTEVWLAERDGEALGTMTLTPDLTGGCDILQDKHTIHITNAFVKQHARTQGIGLALVNRCLERAVMRGFTRCAVDFEAANVLAARFWLRHFEPACYTLIRWIDERLPEAK
jgi:GNAT superfamily N-acetyltransferase